jgi:hypothetical protein
VREEGLLDGKEDEDVEGDESEDVTYHVGRASKLTSKRRIC